MSRTTFTTLLSETLPEECLKLFELRLLELKGLNNQIGLFLFDYMMINKHYAGKLRKIVDTKGERLNQLIEQYIKKEVRGEKYKKATSLGEDHLGDFGEVWTAIIADIKEEIEISEAFCSNMEKQLISPLKKCFDINKNKKYANMLNSVGEMEHYDDAELAQVCELFENFEFNRLLFLKDAFISFQNNLNFRFNENLKHNETLFSLLVGFDPDKEIERFGRVLKTTLTSVDRAEPHAEPHPVEAASNGAEDGHISKFFHHHKDHDTSDPPTTGFRAPPPVQPPLVTSKSNHSINSSATEKRRSTIRSRVGTLFGKRKKKEKHELLLAVVDEASIQSGKLEARSSFMKEAKVAHETEKEPEHTLDAHQKSEAQTQPEIPQKPEFQQPLSMDAVPLVPQKVEHAPEHIAEPVPQSLPEPIQKDTMSGAAKESDDVGPLPPAPRKSRKDIQLKLFTNLTTADVMDQGREELPPLPKNAPASIADARVLLHGNPSNLSLSSARNSTNKFIHPDLKATGLNASILEQIRVVMRDGKTESCQIIGEVAMTYFKSPVSSVPSSALVRITGAENITKLIPNKTFLVPEEDYVFRLNPLQISLRTLGGLKYMVKGEELPVAVVPVWRFEPHQASCMLGIRLSESVMARIGEQSIFLDGLVVSISVDEGVAVKLAMSRPSGTFNKEKRRITWKFSEPVELSVAKPEEKIVARFLTDGVAKEGKSGAQVRFVVGSGRGGEQLVSNVGLEYMGEDGWEGVNVAKTFSVGGFESHYT